MQSNWEKIFYKKQFQFLKSCLEDIPKTYYEQEAIKLRGQIGQPFSTVLELGAGHGEMANALATNGKLVTTIELVEEIANSARQHAHPNVVVNCEDFYQISLPFKFDAVLYLDGFGVGNDEEQLYLLHRIYNWLAKDGYALIDIYQPQYWQKIKGLEMLATSDSGIMREYGYDEQNHRMSDTWWHVNEPNDKVTQSLACYTTEEIYQLCQLANLQIIAYYPGGAMDYETWTYHEVVPLDQCLSYRIKVRRKI